MIADLLLVIVGLGSLTLGGTLVVAGASGMGRRFGLSPMVVGLTIVAAGTSAPELAVVLQSVVNGDSELAVGAVIGSNIANILLVLGVAATMATIKISSRVVRIDVPVMIGVSILFFVLSIDGELGHLDGLLLVGILAVFLPWTVWAARSGSDLSAAEAGEPSEPFDGQDEPFEGHDARFKSLPVLLAVFAGGLSVLVVSSRVVVTSAEDLALYFGVPPLVVGLTVVALGTSAPEVVTTVVASIRGERDIAVGNAVGSNIFNILLVLGVPSLIAGVAVSEDALALDLPIMLAVAVACLPLVAWDRRLDRWKGMVFLGYYVAYLLFLVLDATDHQAKESFGVVMVVFVVPLTVITAATVIAGGLAEHRRRIQSSAEPAQKGA